MVFSWIQLTCVCALRLWLNPTTNRSNKMYTSDSFESDAATVSTLDRSSLFLRVWTSETVEKALSLALVLRSLADIRHLRAQTDTHVGFWTFIPVFSAVSGLRHVSTPSRPIAPEQSLRPLIQRIWQTYFPTSLLAFMYFVWSCPRAPRPRRGLFGFRFIRVLPLLSSLLPRRCALPTRLC